MRVQNGKRSLMIMQTILYGHIKGGDEGMLQIRVTRKR
jgi:hypothetical protein